MHPVMDPPKRSRTISTSDFSSPSAIDGRETAAAVRELLDLLPADVLGDIRSGEIDTGDPAFLSGLMDHASRLSIADPQKGRRMLGKIMRLKKLLHRSLRESDPGLAVTATIVSEGKRTGRNDACPCGSGRKFKQCCMRKA